jgi:uncharacterized protein YaeQ
MALPSTIYKAAIEVADVDRGVYGTVQTAVARHPSETEERLVLRLLASALFFDPELAFTKGICAGDEPDLWLKSPDDRVLLWVEVGLPEPERLLKACRHAGRVALLAAGRSLWNWEQQHLPKLSAVGNLSVAALDQEVINKLVARLARSITWSVTISEHTLYLNVGADTFETPVRMLAGER